MRQAIGLRSPPGNRLEALRGDLQGLRSIRIDDQGRIVLRWAASGPAEVRFVDAHSRPMHPTERIPTHPGEVLLEEFLAPMEITQVELAAHDLAARRPARSVERPLETGESVRSESHARARSTGLPASITNDDGWPWSPPCGREPE